MARRNHNARQPEQPRGSFGALMREYNGQAAHSRRVHRAAANRRPSAQPQPNSFKGNQPPIVAAPEGSIAVGRPLLSPNLMAWVHEKIEEEVDGRGALRQTLVQPYACYVDPVLLAERAATYYRHYKKVDRPDSEGQAMAQKRTITTWKSTSRGRMMRPADVSDLVLVPGDSSISVNGQELADYDMQVLLDHTSSINESFVAERRTALGEPGRGLMTRDHLPPIRIGRLLLPEALASGAAEAIIATVPPELREVKLDTVLPIPVVFAGQPIQIESAADSRHGFGGA